jgi:tetratricopeptide (TPR) repeat protein
MTIRYRIKILLVILFAVQFILVKQGKVYAQTDDDYKNIKKANKAYVDEKFDSAVTIYEKIITKGYIAPELNYNLGNAYYRLGDYKRAILNYERALLLNPDDENTKANLELSQRFIQDKIDVVPTFFLIRWLQAFVDMFSANTWSYINIFSFVLFLVLITLFLFSGRVPIRKLSIYFGFLLIVISIISFYCAYSQDQKQSSHSTAIIFSPAVTVKSSPNKNGTDLFIIHEGLKVVITGESSGWKEIRLSDGKIGWLPAKTIEKI